MAKIGPDLTLTINAFAENTLYGVLKKGVKLVVRGKAKLIKG